MFKCARSISCKKAYSRMNQKIKPIKIGRQIYHTHLSKIIIIITFVTVVVLIQLIFP